MVPMPRVFLPNRSRRLRHVLGRSTALGSAILLLATPTIAAEPLPTGATVVSGAATFAPVAGVSLGVALGAVNTIIEYTGFSVPTGTTVNFTDGRAAGVAGTNGIAVLNRVIGVGGVVPQSEIFGSLTSAPNVSVFLINPTGILFGNGAAVNVGGLVASTVALSNASFNTPGAGYNFMAPAATGVVTVTAGASISTQTSTLGLGSVALIGAQVVTGGTISALREVGIVAATDVSITFVTGSPLSIRINRGTSLNAPIVATGSIGGNNVVFAAATQTTVTNALLDIEAVVTATAAAATDRGIVLVAGPSPTTDPNVVFTPASNNDGIIGTTLGGSLTATGAGGGVTILTSGGIARPAIAGSAVLSARSGLNVRAASGDIVLGDATSTGASAAVRADAGTAEMAALTGRTAATARGTVLTIGSALSSNGTVSLTSTSGTLTAATIDADDDVTITAATDAFIDTASGAAISISGANLSGPAGGRTALSSRAAIGLTLTGSARLGAVASDSGAAIVATDIDAASLAATNGAVTATASAGDLVLGSASASGDVRLRALSGTIDAGTLASGSLIDARAGALRIGSVGTAALVLTSDVGVLTLGGGSAAAATIAAATDLIVTGTLTATGASVLTAGGSVAGGSVTTTDTLSVVAGTTVDAAVLGGNAGLTATGTSVTLGTASATAGTALLTSTSGALQIGNGSVQTATINAATSLAITATLAATGNTILTAGTSITGGSVTSSGTLLAIAGTTVDAATLRGNAGLTVTGTAVTLGTASASAGTALLTSTSGALQVGSGSVQTATIDAATSLAITGTLAASGNIVLTAGTGITSGSVTSSGGTLRASAGAVIDAASLAGADGLTVGGTAITLGNAGAASGNAVLTASAGGVSVGSASTGGILSIIATGLASLTGAASIGTDLSVTGSGVVLGDGTPTLQRADGGIAIIATGGAIIGNTGLVLRANADGLSNEALTLASTGGGIDFVAGSTIEGGPAFQSDVIFTFGTPGTPLALGAVTARRLGAMGGIINDAAISLRGTVTVVESLDVTTTAGSIRTAGIAVTGPAGTLRLAATAAGSDITGTGTFSAGGDISVTAARSIAIGTAHSTVGSVFTAAGTGMLAATELRAGDRIAAQAATSAGIGSLVSGTAAGFANGGATVTAASIDIGSVAIGSALVATASTGALTIGGGIVGTSLSLGSVGPLTIAGVLQAGTTVGSNGLVSVTTAADARIDTLRSLTGDVTVTAGGDLSGIPATSGAIITAPGAGRNVSVTGGGSVLLANASSGNNVTVIAGSALTVDTTLDVVGNLLLTGASVALGAGTPILQRAGGRIEIISITGAITGQPGLTLLSNSDGVGGGDLILRSAAGIALDGAILQAGPARQSVVRIGVSPGTALSLGSVSARGLVSYDSGFAATALDHDGAVTIAAAMVTDNLLIGTALLRPTSIAIGSAASSAGGIDLRAGSIRGLAATGPDIGRAVLSAATSVTIRSDAATLGTLTAGTAIDAATTGDLDIRAASAGTSIVLAAGGALGIDNAVAATSLAASGNDVTGLAGGRAALTAASIAVTANGSGSTDGIVRLGDIDAASAIDVIGRAIDITSAVVSAGALAIEALELAPVSDVSLRLGSASAAGDLRLTSRPGSGANPAAANGSISLGSGTSGTGDLVLTAGGAVTGLSGDRTMLTAPRGNIFLTAGTQVLGGTVAAGIAATLVGTNVDVSSVTAAAGPLAITATAADLRLGTGTAGGSAVLTALGGAATIAAFTAGGALVVDAATIDATALAANSIVTTSTGASQLGDSTAAGALQANAGTTLGFGSLASTAGNIVLNAGGAITGASVTAFTAVDLSGESIDIGTVSAGGSVTTSTRGASDLGSVLTAASIAATAGTTLDFASLTSTGGAITLGAGGTLAGTRLDAAQAIRLTAGSIAVDTAAAGTTLTTSSAGATRITTASGNSGLSLLAGAAVDFGTVISRAGSIRLHATGAITGDSAIAATSVDITGGSIVLTGIDAGMTLSTDSVGATLLGRATAGSDAAMTAGTTLGFATIATGSGGIDLAAGGALAGTGLVAATAIDLTGGSIDIGSIGAGTALTAISTGTATLGTAMAQGNVTLTAASLGFGSVTSSRGDVVADVSGSIGGTALFAGRAIGLTGGSILVGTVTAGTTLGVSSSAKVDLATAIAGGDITIDAGSDFGFGSVISSGGNATLAATGAIAGTVLAASQAVLVNGSSIALTGSTAGGGFTTTSTGASNFGTVVAAGDVLVRAGTSLGFGSIASSGGNASVSAATSLVGSALSAARAIVLDPIDIAIGTITAGTTLMIRSSGSTTLADAVAGGAITVDTGTTFDFTALRSTGGSVRIDAGGAVTGATVTAAAAVSIDAGRIALTDGTAGAGLATTSVGDSAFGTLTAAGDILVTTGAGLDFGRIASSGGVTLAGGSAVTGAQLVASRAIGVTGTSIDIGTISGQAMLTATSAGATRFGTATAAGNIDIASGGDLSFGSIDSSGGGITILARGNSSGDVLAAGTVLGLTSTSGTIAIDNANAGGNASFAAALGIDAGAVAANGALAMTTSAGPIRLGSGRSGGDMVLVASGDAGIAAGLTIGGDLVVSAAGVDLARAGTAVQTARGSVAITANTGAITGGSGLTLVSGNGGGGQTLTLKALGSRGTVDFAPGSAIIAGTPGAGADITISATELARLGNVTATGRSIAIGAADADLAGTVRSREITLTNTATANPLRIGTAPATNTAEFSALAPRHFDLSGAEVARLDATVLRVDAKAQNVSIGDVALGSANGSTSVAVRTTARIDLLGRLEAAASAPGRSITLGGDGTTGKASIVRIAATAAAGGRIIADGAAVSLFGDRIGAGFDSGLLRELGIAPAGGTSPSAQDIATRFVSQPNSTLYVATQSGQQPYSDAVIIRAGALAVNYGSFALFQNTGQPGISTGVVLTGIAGAPTLQIVAGDASVTNNFAVFGTVDGFGGVATSLLGGDTITINGAVSRGNTRANGCLIGSAGGGCLAASVAQPALLIFESNSEIFGSSNALALPFDPLVGTSNEALFSDIAGIDIGVDDVPCPAGGAACTEGKQP